MSHADAKRWQGARTLADLGALTALWLEGRIASQPAYRANTGPSEETADLIPVLAAVNRAGFVTESSQPGITLDASGWEQRAAVSGFASEETMAALDEVVQATGLMMTAWRASAKRTRYTSRIVVTRRHGRPFTGFGAQESREYLREMYDDCHPEAVEALCRAWQVTVVDLAWGRNDRLWPALEEFAQSEEQARFLAG